MSRTPRWAAIVLCTNSMPKPIFEGGALISGSLYSASICRRDPDCAGTVAPRAVGQRVVVGGIDLQITRQGFARVLGGRQKPSEGPHQHRPLLRRYANGGTPNDVTGMCWRKHFPDPGDHRTLDPHPRHLVLYFPERASDYMAVGSTHIPPSLSDLLHPSRAPADCARSSRPSPRSCYGSGCSIRCKACSTAR